MNSTITRVWHAALAAVIAVIAVAIVWQTLLNIDDDRSLVNLFSYFTIQSNLLMMVAAAGVALDPKRSGRLFGAVRVAGLVGITVTGNAHGAGFVAIACVLVTVFAVLLAAFYLRLGGVRRESPV